MATVKPKVVNEKRKVVEVFDESGFNALFRQHTRSASMIFAFLCLFSVFMLLSSLGVSDAWPLHLIITLMIMKSTASMFYFSERLKDSFIRFTMKEDTFPAVEELVVLVLLLISINFMRSDKKGPWELTLFYNAVTVIFALATFVRIRIIELHKSYKIKKNQ